MSFIVVIGDIIGSKSKINEYENQIKQELQSFYAIHKKVLSSQVKLKSGDEIQFVISTKDIDNLFKMIRTMKASVLPLKLRIGVGIGDIYNYTDSNADPLELNGEAFYNARDAIERAKIKKQQSVNYNTYLYSKEYDVIEINLNLRILDILTNKWKKEMFAIARLDELDLSHDTAALLLYSFSKLSIKEREDFFNHDSSKDVDLSKIDTTSEKARKSIDSISSNLSKKMKSSFWYEVRDFEKSIINSIKEKLL